MQAGNINMINDVFKALHNSGRGINQVGARFFPQNIDFSSLLIDVSLVDEIFSQEVFHVAVSRYVARPEKDELLVQLLKWMPGQGYTLTSSSIDLILKNSSLFGQRHLILDILAQKHKTLKKPVVL